MKSPSGFGRQPNVSNKIKENAVSEQAAQQPTIETDLIRKAGIQAQNPTVEHKPRFNPKCRELSSTSAGKLPVYSLFASGLFEAVLPESQ